MSKKKAKEPSKVFLDLQEAMARKGHRPIQVVNALGVSLGTWYKWQHGSTPIAAHAEKIRAYVSETSGSPT